MLAVPGLLLAIGIVATFGQGLVQIMFAIGAVNAPVFARVLRGSILGQRENDIDLAGLGFLGLGPQDPGTPEWGTMMTHANYYVSQAPVLAIIPGVAIMISVLGFNLIGDGLREALDPK